MQKYRAQFEVQFEAESDEEAKAVAQSVKVDIGAVTARGETSFKNGLSRVVEYEGFHF